MVLRIKVLLQAAESRVPTKHVSEELKQSLTLKRDVREIRDGSSFGSEQSVCDEVGEFDKTMGKVTNAVEFDPGGTHNQHSPKQSGRALVN